MIFLVDGKVFGTHRDFEAKDEYTPRYGDQTGGSFLNILFFSFLIEFSM